MRVNSALFSISFRPFFILAALIAAINPLIWILNYLGQITVSISNVSPLFWHGHEMIFGFSGALIGGFILTASANWTGSVPYQGKSLALLAILWSVERFSYFLPINSYLFFILMNLFFPALLIMLLRKLWKFPKQRNVFIPILLGITLGKLLHSWGNLFSIEVLEYSGKQVAIGLVRLIILLIAGRVIPFFTRKRISGVQIDLPQWINPIALLPIVLLVYPWPESTPKFILGFLFIYAFIANTMRQFMWKPFVTFKVPILYVLHIGIAFINLELLLEFLGLIYDQVNFSYAAIHLLLAGGLGVVGLGIMTRVTLGHTGRLIVADKWTRLSYGLVILGALVRVIIPILFQEHYVSSLYCAVVLWSLGFFIFFLKYLKFLLNPRPDGKAY